MTGAKESMLTRIIAASAERLAQDPRIPLEAREAFRQAAVTTMHGLWSSAFGGETAWVRLYVPRRDAPQREARRRRILAALAAGELPARVADREGVTLRWVQKLDQARRAAGANSPCMESSRSAVDDG